ncbi:MAG TPA: HAMP domain-containing histidine kinase [Candidatus Choladousia intestinavium]|uniref:histidine kinase n=1 Tax=Candidatus Choladousia intestinavium TaxID=2840727 RepID=A0A9D1DAG1_9FIRM|nr:HAMP domain-containing histidine kinase [Candidatus Choladousia intestinavium]
MGRLIYKKWAKVLLMILQTAAACLLVFSVIRIGFWLEDSLNLNELSRDYEESELFLGTVNTIIENKIRGQQNLELFEKDGEFYGKREIDIQSYGEDQEAVQDLNTTYLLEDLLSFCEDGGREALHSAISQAQEEEHSTGQEAGELLSEQAYTLETILPITGIPLTECSRWYSDSASFLFRMYVRLDEVCQDIWDRYQEYQNVQDETWSPDAPSNLRYCIENTATGKLYTNMNVSSFDEAASALEEEDGFVALYEGERSFNIMVANPDNVLNDAAADWFMTNRFVDTNEKVFLAVNLSYPVSDLLQTLAEYYSGREGIVWTSVLIAAGCLAVMAAGFILSLLGAGWKEGRLTPVLLRIDRIPTEVALGIYMIAGTIFLIYFFSIKSWGTVLYGINGYPFGAVLAGSYLIFLSGCLSLARRIKCRTLWSNSVCRMLVKTWQQVRSARMISGLVLLVYVIFFALNFLFLLCFRRTGVLLVLIMDMAVLLYLLRDMVGKQSVWEGIHQISQGDLSYKIDISTLQGETYEMGKAVNEMGDGLQKAVDAIVKNERLKAELITNVSHDIKTPLTSIINYVDLLKRENLPGERANHYLEVLDQKSQRLRQLTEDLVEASKISSGNIELHMMRMQFQSMLSQALGEFEERLEEKQLLVKLDFPKEPVYIQADGRQLWRVLENLLGNIFKYAKENTSVEAVLTCSGGRAVFTLKNISREKITVEAQELSGRFVRGDKSRTTEGSGLGLSIAQSLTELMNGSFRLQAEGEEFSAILDFPVADAEREQPENSRPSGL